MPQEAENKKILPIKWNQRKKYHKNVFVQCISKSGIFYTQTKYFF